MHRPRPTFWIATAAVAALALGGGVAAARDGDASSTRGRTHIEDRAHPEDSTSTSSTSVPTLPTSTPTTPAPTTPAVVPPTAPSGSNDDPATHDVGDDHGVDDPATHDVGDDHGVDDPATHDVGDDHSGSNRGPGHGRKANRWVSF